jgi:2-polyprenyl-6-methoxyphenol hydroxylase-like FAD-dependent oxidoreductase
LVQYFDGARHLSVWPAGSEVPGGPLRCAVAMNVSLEEADALRERGRSRDHMTRLCPEIGKLLRGQSDNADLHVFRYRDVELSTYSAGRAVLIGDAAHSMSPQLGVGAQLAMEDAAVLADKLAEHSDLSAALRAYALTRPIQLSRYHQASRWLTPLFQSDSGLLAGIRDRFLGSAIHGAFAKRLARELFC